MPIHVISIVTVSLNGLFFNYHVHLIFSAFIVRFRCVQAMFYIDLVREKLLLLNNRIERDVTRREPDKFHVQKDKIFIVAEKYHFKREIKNPNVSLYDTLLVMKTIYGKIWDITNLLNDCFGYSLLCIVSKEKKSVKIFLFKFYFSNSFKKIWKGKNEKILNYSHKNSNNLYKAHFPP